MCVSVSVCCIAYVSCTQIQMRVEAKFVRDVLHGDDVTEIRLRLLEVLEDEAPPEDD